jgi:hypothetical protein
MKGLKTRPTFAVLMSALGNWTLDLERWTLASVQNQPFLD